MHKEYRKLWKEMGYDDGMGSAEVVPPPPREYRRVYHLLSADHGVSDISLKQMKVARFANLNDPFELMAVRSRARHRPEMASMKGNVDSKYGLLSFSANWTNPVLWGHYGDRHRGICLGFNVKDDLAEKVLYEDKRIIKALEEIKNPERLDAKLRATLFRTKFSSWKYEQERRIILQLSEAKSVGDMHFYPIGPNIQLAEVILGYNCALPLLEVRALVNSFYGNVTTFLSRLADGHFAVVPEECTVP